MNIQLLSDLHLESNPLFTAQPLAGADVLVLAGDIGSYQQGSALLERGIEDFGLARFSPKPVAEGGAGWPTPVLFVPGNHEYDGLDFDEAHAAMADACERWGITWLAEQSVVLGGVRFVGSTLWTDFDALTPPPFSGLSNLDGPPNTTLELAHEKTRQKARDKAFRAANYYLSKNHTLRAGQPMLAADVRELGIASHAWLRAALAQPFAGPTVAITHFAPSLLSADPRFGLAPGTAGFCNALDDLLPSAQLWLHGHLHCPQDYVASGCRVVANPLGYARKGEQEGFRPDWLINVFTVEPH